MPFKCITVSPDDQATGLWDENFKLIELSRIALPNEILEDLINMQTVYNSCDFYTMDEDSSIEYHDYFCEFSKRIANKIKKQYPDIDVKFQTKEGLLETL